MGRQRDRLLMLVHASRWCIFPATIFLPIISVFYAQKNIFKTDLMILKFHLAGSDFSLSTVLSSSMEMIIHNQIYCLTVVLWSNYYTFRQKTLVLLISVKRHWKLPYKNRRLMAEANLLQIQMDCMKDKSFLRSKKKELISTANLVLLGFFSYHSCLELQTLECWSLR